MSDAITRLNRALAGRYAIASEIGQGGMATVYLADDLKHERKVALKVLKPELAAIVGAERFLAEIKTTATLQHPHILPLFDSGEAEGFLFYVMPYVEGESLRERLDREHQLPIEDAVRIATDLAEALDYAHRHGVIHRDIKPGNVLLHDGQPVIADFGIALAVGAAGGHRLTETGLSLGTPHYMSPEQATGDQTVGPTTDIYALGCVLYEMLIGEAPYTGSTPQAVLGKIIAGEPASATTVRKSVPANVDAAIAKALEKLPADRFQSAQNFAAALRVTGFRTDTRRPVARRGAGGSWNRLSIGLATVAGALVALSLWALSTSEAPKTPIRTVIPGLAENQLARSGFKLGPAGAGIVYFGPLSDGGASHWYRSWQDTTASRLDIPQGQTHGGLSPDGSEFAFASDVTSFDLRIIALPRGPTRTIVEDSARCCASFGPDGYVYFTGLGGGVSRVLADGSGTVERITELSDGDLRHFRVRALHDGKGAVFEVRGDPRRIEAVRFDTGERTVLADGVSPEITPTGHLVFATLEGQILAGPLDAEALVLRSAPVPLADGVFVPSGQWPSPPWHLSPDGTLAYWLEPDGANDELVWVTRTGATTPVDPSWSFGFTEANVGWDLSPGGSRIALAAAAEGVDQVFIKDLSTGLLTQLTSEPRGAYKPRWLDDHTLVYASQRDGDNRDLYSQNADGTGAPRLITDHDLDISESAFSPDGRWAVIRQSVTIRGSLGGRGILIVDLASPDRVAQPLLVTPGHDNTAPALSPDGQWIAYMTNESARFEVRVASFPDVSLQDVPVSLDGGYVPLWSPDGRELFYLDGNGNMLAATYAADPTFEITGRDILFQVETNVSGPGYPIAINAVDREGRILMMRRTAGRMMLIHNWLEELKAWVPD